MVGMNRTLTDICLVVGNPYADALEETYLIASFTIFISSLAVDSMPGMTDMIAL